MTKPLQVTEKDILTKERQELLIDSIKRNVKMLESSINNEHAPNIEATAHVLQVWLKELEKHGKAVWESNE
ncbi:hypothetical protein HWC53_gp062 [Bacillus phage vB_BmeM-Goe8]|uniref:Uncharacterized protein n=1 Tax=Bacillus phage vB_BmeM-Goe8 TaxID=2593638 RepID=A0A516KN68_9CAUD|nr:hypothetical protein HWC53_gp016 [Bacillus phage vB_BmeM-Goe8]YP_009850188.1 hypothetical protein HWC53_gp062 [Bacillus phage vB_BmeM-Goe8]QDP42800.1 hypothetical protein Goe8_c00160 [Bacillus phage vB_BmeM-Goe8]QDP43027.1 hypothetical protein Goe8_c02540 [Bacillus phage vB_BmeM-Goe8]